MGLAKRAHLPDSMEKHKLAKAQMHHTETISPHTMCFHDFHAHTEDEEKCQHLMRRLHVTRPVYIFWTGLGRVAG